MFWRRIIMTLYTAKKTNRSNGRSGTSKVATPYNKRTTDCLRCSYNHKKGRVRTPYHYGKLKRRQGRGRQRGQINDRQPCCIYEHRKDNICNFGNKGSRNLERHGRQWHEVGHLTIIIIKGI